MPTFKEWEDDIKEQSLADLQRYLKALQDLGDWDMFRKSFKQYLMFALIPDLRTHIALKAKAMCSRCHSNYLNNWTVDDIVTVTGKVYEERKVCPECYDELIEEGLIDPEVQNDSRR